MQYRNSFLSSIPNFCKHILIINVICFFTDVLLQSRGLYLNQILGLHYIMSSKFHIWQPLTYMFMHGSISHLFFNMFALWMFATPLERQWGEKRFMTYYFITGIGAGLVQEIVWGFMFGALPVPTVTIGASGAVFGILFAFGWLFPDTKMFIFPLPIPIKARIFVLIYAVFELFFGLKDLMGMSRDNIAHFAHLGGFVFGWLLIIWWRRKDGTFYVSTTDFRIKDWVQKWYNVIRQKINQQQKHSNPHEGYHYQNPIPNNQSSTGKNTDTDKDKDKDKDKEIDAILDKIRKSGYDSLTAEEKAKLFKR